VADLVAAVVVAVVAAVAVIATVVGKKHTSKPAYITADSYGSNK